MYKRIIKGFESFLDVRMFFALRIMWNNLAISDEMFIWALKLRLGFKRMPRNFIPGSLMRIINSMGEISSRMFCLERSSLSQCSLQ
jgi:hypothetical protein